MIAQHPRLGGVAWDYLQYPVGLARLGHDVYYLEDSGEWPYTEDGGLSGSDWVARDPSANVAHLARVMDRFGLADRWAYRFPLDDVWYGLGDRERERVLNSADLLLNVSGTLEHPERYRLRGVMAYVDSDPVFTQVKIARNESNGSFRGRVDAHDVHFSFGETLGDSVPDTGHEWLPTRQPILLSEWRPHGPHRGAFTTVMSWTSYRPLEYAGRTYAQKDVELRRFLDLPSRVKPTVLELALPQIHHADWEAGDAPAGIRPEEELTAHGWRIVDAGSRCASLDAYRSYVESSSGEWSVAKHGYVVGGPGWFSCRSACYLAAGRPVVVQDTGFADVLPVGEGIVTFRNVDEAASAVREVEANYRRHAAAARALAEEYFESDKVLSALVEEATR